MRRPDWEERLSAYLTAAAHKPHRYGSHDCILNTANVVRALTGKDLAKGHRGKYRSKAGAQKYLAKLGHKNIGSLLDTHLKRKPSAFAQRGDIVLDQSGVPGVVLGGDALFVGQTGKAEGLVRKPRTEWRKRAWSVE